MGNAAADVAGVLIIVVGWAETVPLRGITDDEPEPTSARFMNPSLIGRRSQVRDTLPMETERFARLIPEVRAQEIKSPTGSAPPAVPALAP
jgi:hypothetical protein